MQQLKKSDLKIKAWNLLSKIIRLSYSDFNGYCSCVTCGATRHWSELHAGHFISKSGGNSIYFLEKNIHPQCVSCNIFENGNIDKYEKYMIETYGLEEVEKLYEIKKLEMKITIQDYQEMIIIYKQRLKGLL